MDALHTLMLALLQGLTEFLPVSSSAHLILGGQAFGWSDQGLVFDVATHLGTLFAVLVYFRRDLFAMAASSLHPPRSAEDRRNRSLLAAIALGIFVLSMKMAERTQEVYTRDSAEYRAAVEERIRPLGRVTLSGEDIAASAAVGMHLQTITLPSGWAGIDAYDYSLVDSYLIKTLEADRRLESTIVLMRAFDAPQR